MTMMIGRFHQLLVHTNCKQMFVRSPVVATACPLSSAASSTRRYHLSYCLSPVIVDSSLSPQYLNNLNNVVSNKKKNQN